MTGLQPADWGDIIPFFDFYTKSTFCFPIKIVVENKIAGVGASIIHNEVAWLAHIIVHPEYRNKGIGQLITQALVKIAVSKNCATIYLIATELGVPVYKKAGFETETEYLVFKEITIAGGPEVSGKIKRYDAVFKEQVLNIDRSNSGEERLSLYENYLQSGFVYCEGQTVEGFYLPAFGNGPIIANTQSAGIALLTLHLKSYHHVILPIDNKTAVDFLYSQGLKQFNTIKRMRLGKYRPVKFSNLYNRTGGNKG